MLTRQLELSWVRTRVDSWFACINTLHGIHCVSCKVSSGGLGLSTVPYTATAVLLTVNIWPRTVPYFSRTHLFESIRRYGTVKYIWCRSLRGRLICAVAKLALAIKFFYICRILTIPLEDHLLGSEQVISACLENNQVFSQFTKPGLNQVPPYPNMEIRSQCGQFGSLKKNNSFNFVFNEKFVLGICSSHQLKHFG